MTYKKDSPTSPDGWRQRTIQPCILAHDALAQQAANTTTPRSSIDISLCAASPNTLPQASSAVLHGTTVIIESPSSASLDFGQLASSSSSIDNDDDYDSCFEEEDANTTFTLDDGFIQMEEEVHEEDFNSDDESDTELDPTPSSSEFDTKDGVRNLALESESINGALLDLPHWWGEEDCGTFLSLSLSLSIPNLSTLSFKLS